MEPTERAPADPPPSRTAPGTHGPVNVINKDKEASYFQNSFYYAAHTGEFRIFGCIVSRPG